MPEQSGRSLLTLLFTDVERSTEMVDRLGEVASAALLRHHAIVREVVESHGGRLFERIGDAAYASFVDAGAAVRAAAAVHARLAAEDWGAVGRLRVRIALDSGELEERDGRYLGRALYRCARLQALAKGGETLLSGETLERLAGGLPDGVRLRDLGPQRLRGLRGTVRAWALVPGAAAAAEADARRPIRVLLVDDYEVVRRGLRGFLELVPGIEVVGEAGDGRTALDAAHRLQPDVVLMDLVMPVMDGPTAIAALRETQPGVSVVALTSFTEPERIASALEAGAVAHLQKDADPEQVVGAVRAAAGR
ncbi:MAG TPA: response regulator [Candidatus Limnocylindria bacterium]